MDELNGRTFAPLNRSDVILKRHPIGPGGCYVKHRRGVVLGEVLRWPDGVWVAYAGEVRPSGLDEKSGEGHSREDAIAVLLHPHAHMPPMLGVLCGKSWRRVRDATEAECREECPEQWAWWDKVRPLFEVSDG